MTAEVGVQLAQHFWFAALLVVTFGLAAGLLTRSPWKQALAGCVLGLALHWVAWINRRGMPLVAVPAFVGVALLVFGGLRFLRAKGSASQPDVGPPLLLHWRGEITLTQATLHLGKVLALVIVVVAMLEVAPMFYSPRLISGLYAATWILGVAVLGLLLVGTWRVAGGARYADRSGLKWTTRVVVGTAIALLAGVVAEVGGPRCWSYIQVARGGRAPDSLKEFAGPNLEAPSGRDLPVAHRTTADLASAPLAGFDLTLLPVDSPNQEELAWTRYVVHSEGRLIGAVSVFRIEPKAYDMASAEEAFDPISRIQASNVRRVSRWTLGPRVIMLGELREPRKNARYLLWFRAYEDIGTVVAAPTEDDALILAEALHAAWPVRK